MTKGPSSRPWVDLGPEATSSNKLRRASARRRGDRAISSKLSYIARGRHNDVGIEHQSTRLASPGHPVLETPLPRSDGCSAGSGRSPESLRDSHHFSAACLAPIGTNGSRWHRSAGPLLHRGVFWSVAQNLSLLSPDVVAEMQHSTHAPDRASRGS